MGSAEWQILPHLFSTACTFNLFKPPSHSLANVYCGVPGWEYVTLDRHNASSFLC